MLVNNDWKSDFKQHALLAYPNECLGFLFDNNTYMPVSEGNDSYVNTTAKIFIEYEDMIKAICHSHTSDKLWPSKVDMIAQMRSALPSALVFCKENICSEPLFFGDIVFRKEYLGRQYVSGITDCYTLIRDYYWFEKNIFLPEFPRDNNWHETMQDMYERHLNDVGVDKIELNSIKSGDVVLLKIGKTISHAGIFIEPNLLLHHARGKYSIKEPLEKYSKFIKKVVRYVGNNSQSWKTQADIARIIEI